MLVNKTVIMSIFTNLKTTFHKAFDNTETQWQKIAMRVPSTGAQNDYAWLSKFPRMQKWIGDKAIKSLSAYRYTIVNDDYEATVEVDRNHIEDDNIGIYGPQAEAAGQSAKMLPEEIVFELVGKGHEELCFDGQPFFDIDHPVKTKEGETESVSNKGNKALEIDTLAKAEASYGAARTAMRLFKDDEGRPLSVSPNILLVGPALENRARILLTADRLEDGKTNPFKGTAELVVGDYIEGTNWYLLDTKKPIKPFIYQERKKPVFVSQTDMNATDVFTRRQYKFGAEARAAGGYGFWQLAYANITE